MSALGLTLLAPRGFPAWRTRRGHHQTICLLVFYGNCSPVLPSINAAAGGGKPQRGGPARRMIKCGRGFGSSRRRRAGWVETNGMSRKVAPWEENPESAHLPVAEGPAIEAPRVGEAGDARLIERARAGDDLAFAALVARYEQKLIRVLARLVHDEELARDLAQETFWKVYNRLDRFDTARRFGPWLFRIGVNLGLDLLRRHDVPAVASLDRPRGDGGQSLELADPDPRLREELAQEVHFVLERLPLPYRMILVLRDLEGFSSAEVAAIVRRREATVRWRLAKARELFRHHWERRQAEPGEGHHVE
jgi:RNA polymerase sigma-70 factor (ECF subfamily)